MSSVSSLIPKYLNLADPEDAGKGFGKHIWDIDPSDAIALQKVCTVWLVQSSNDLPRSEVPKKAFPF